MLRPDAATHRREGPVTDLHRLPAGTHKIGHATVVVSGPVKLPAGQKRGTDLGDKFEALWKVFGDPAFPLVREYQFDATRRFRFDACYLREKVAVELDGGVHGGGRHTRGAGFEKDCEKLNLAASRGWVVLRYTAKDLTKGRGPETVKAVCNLLSERAKHGGL